MDKISTLKNSNLNSAAKKLLNDAQSDFDKKYQTVSAVERIFKSEYSQFFDKFDNLLQDTCLKATEDEIKEILNAVIKYCEASIDYNDSVSYLNDVLEALSEE